MSKDNSNKELILKIAYFTTLTGASILFGFSYSLSKIRKNSNVTPSAQLHDEAVGLARKALMRATLYSVGTMSIFAIASYHLVIKSIIKNQEEKRLSQPQESTSQTLNALLGP